MKKTALVIVAWLTALAAAQAPAPMISISNPPKHVLAGSKFTVYVSLTFSAGLHAYQNPPTSEYDIPVTVKVSGKEFKVQKISYPTGINRAVGGNEKPTKAYEGTIRIPVTLIAPTTAGFKNLKVIVGFQQCDETSCFPPDEVVKSIKVNVRKKVAKV